MTEREAFARWQAVSGRCSEDWTCAGCGETYPPGFEDDVCVVCAGPLVRVLLRVFYKREG